MQQLLFVWDRFKAEANLQKHGVAFEEAATIFRDPLLLVIPDLEHSQEEERWIALGTSRQHLLLVVIHTRSINAFASSAHAKPGQRNEETMKSKETTKPSRAAKKRG